MFRIVLVSLLFIFSINVFSQSSSPKKTNQDKVNISKEKSLTNPKTFLENAIIKSKQARKVRVSVDSSIKGNQISSTFEFLSPNKYKVVDIVSGKVTKIIVEIAKQRYQLFNEKWIKTRKDYFPLRDQVDSFFPIKFRTNPDDIYEIKSSFVEQLEDEKIENRETKKFSYTIKYDGLEIVDSGIAWVDKKDGLLVQLETNSNGILGQVNGKWKYLYDVEITIEAPKDFVVQDWVN